MKTYAVGASVVSTSPAFEGGLQAMARADIGTRRREDEDPDDYRGGFAVWSGTSFAAPFVAGRIAALLTSGLMTGTRPVAAAPAAVSAGLAAAKEAVDGFDHADESAHSGTT